MKHEQINEARVLLCSAMADIGCTCERLSEIDSRYLVLDSLDEAREEMADWLNSASDYLRAAAALVAPDREVSP